MAETFIKHEWPGLDKPVYLPDWITVEVKIIPRMSRWTSGTRSDRHTRSTWHDTGNPNTNADSEWTWANSNRPGKNIGAASYNAVFDGRKVIICQRFDEMVGHAANQAGNYTSYAFEQAFGASGGGFEPSVAVGQWLHAGVIVAKGWEVDTSLVMHHFWLRHDGTQKWCPGQILNRNRWSAVVAMTSQRAAEIRDHIRAGQPPIPNPTPYVKPAIIPELNAISKVDGVAPASIVAAGTRWFFVGDRVRTINPTGRYQRADRAAAGVGPDLRVGEEFDIDWITEYGGEVWAYTPYGTRIAMVDVERISDTKGVLP